MNSAPSDVLVYSTDSGEICPTCQQPKSKCECAAKKSSKILGDGKVRVRRETQGRAGKTVTTISGLPLTMEQLAALLKDLKKSCGAGGGVKDGVIEIQGDRCSFVMQKLQSLGYAPRRAGG